MAAHPLFDEVVLEKLQGVADALLAVLPADVNEAVMTLSPGPSGQEQDVAINIETGDPPTPFSLAEPDSVIRAGCDFATAWLGSGHPLPAFRFSCRRGDDGRWTAGIEPMQDW